MSDLGEVLLKVLTAVGIIAVMFCVAMVVIQIVKSFGNFEYKTFNGETGYSNYCYVSRGGIFCSKDGGYIQVENYKEETDE